MVTVLRGSINGCKGPFYVIWERVVLTKREATLLVKQLRAMLRER